MKTLCTTHEPGACYEGCPDAYGDEPVPGKVVEVAALPPCDFCGDPAAYDFRTARGPWAYGCERHYAEHRADPQLGVGSGQLLLLRPLTAERRGDR
jgi:hypothetical protein